MVDLNAHQKRLVRGARRAAYVLRHGRARQAKPIFIFGAQRSGTTMLVDRLRELPQVFVYGETSGAFRNAYLKDHDYVGKLIDRCPVPYVAFKPLTSSHEVVPLLALRPGAKALWMFRRASDRANSAVARFSDDNLRALRAIKVGAPLDTWHARGLSEQSREIINRFALEALSPHDAAALIWLIRNRLFFEQGLERRDDVLLVCYEDLVTKPQDVLAGVCRFLGIEFSGRLMQGIHGRSIGKAATRLGPEVSALCDAYYAQLRETMARQWQALDLPTRSARADATQLATVLEPPRTGAS